MVRWGVELNNFGKGSVGYWIVITGMAVFWLFLLVVGTILNHGISLRTVIVGALAGIVGGGAVVIVRRLARRPG
jgi:hypothetical protein